MTRQGNKTLHTMVARDVADSVQHIVLSARDPARVLKLLENPRQPTSALLAAARRRAARKTPETMR